MIARMISPVMPRLSLRNSRQNLASDALRRVQASARGVIVVAVVMPASPRWCWCFLAGRSCLPHPRIKDCEKQVTDEVGHDDRGGEEQERALERGVVGRVERDVREPAEPGPRELRLGG